MQEKAKISRRQKESDLKGSRLNGQSFLDREGQEMRSGQWTDLETATLIEAIGKVTYHEEEKLKKLAFVYNDVVVLSQLTRVAVQKKSLENFTWESIVTEMKQRAPDVLDFLVAIAVPHINQSGKQHVPPLCTAHRILMSSRWKELSLIQKINGSSRNHRSCRTHRHEKDTSVEEKAKISRRQKESDLKGSPLNGQSFLDREGQKMSSGRWTYLETAILIEAMGKVTYPEEKLKKLASI
ncbi:hypothetical protein ACROYT_G015092 [Oculina patagonica]